LCTTVDPAIFTGYDTIVATVNDGVSADTIRVRLYFGLPPDTPAAGFPINFAVVNSFNPTLVFSGGDPDNDSLAYDLYFGNSPLSLFPHRYHAGCQRNRERTCRQYNLLLEGGGPRLEIPDGKPGVAVYHNEGELTGSAAIAFLQD